VGLTDDTWLPTTISYCSSSQMRCGKGPLVGSMFVAGLVVEEDSLFDLAGWGVRDSKLLSPAKRESLARKIRSIASDQYILGAKPR